MKKRSECNCLCHSPGGDCVVHIAACCEGDDVELEAANCWHPHTRPPALVRETILIACNEIKCNDGDAPFLIDGIYVFDGKQIVHEITGEPLPLQEYFWIYERSLFMGLSWHS